MNDLYSLLMLLVLMIGIIVIVAMVVRRNRYQAELRGYGKLYAFAEQAARDNKQMAEQINTVEQRVHAIQRLLEDAE